MIASKRCAMAPFGEPPGRHVVSRASPADCAEPIVRHCGGVVSCLFPAPGFPKQGRGLDQAPAQRPRGGSQQHLVDAHPDQVLRSGERFDVAPGPFDFASARHVQQVPAFKAWHHEGRVRLQQQIGQRIFSLIRSRRSG